MNQVIVVGRITKDFELKKKDDVTYASNTLAVTRSYKDKNGEYQTDFIPFSVFNNIAKNTYEYCKKGDIVGIKGSLQTQNNQINVNVEKITFISASKTKSDENMNIEPKM